MSGRFSRGLAVLPPPVPLDEYAGAHGMDLGTIQSFAADLAPLLDRTQQGMIFRDEPTETVVRENYGADPGALEAVAERLHARQGESAYAAQALPGLLQRLGDGKALFELAFENRLGAALLRRAFSSLFMGVCARGHSLLGAPYGGTAFAPRLIPGSQSSRPS